MASDIKHTVGGHRVAKDKEKLYFFITDPFANYKIENPLYNARVQRCRKFSWSTSKKNPFYSSEGYEHLGGINENVSVTNFSEQSSRDLLPVKGVICWSLLGLPAVSGVSVVVMKSLCATRKSADARFPELLTLSTSTNLNWRISDILVGFHRTSRSVKYFLSLVWINTKCDNHNQRAVHSKKSIFQSAIITIDFNFNCCFRVVQFEVLLI